jgi:hypothetical protein
MAAGVRKQGYRSATGTPIRSVPREQQTMGASAVQVYYMTPEEIAELEQQWQKKRARKKIRPRRGTTVKGVG